MPEVWCCNLKVSVLWNLPQMNVTKSYWWHVNIVSGNGLMSPGNKPLAEPKLTQIYVNSWLHSVTRISTISAIFVSENEKHILFLKKISAYKKIIPNSPCDAEMGCLKDLFWARGADGHLHSRFALCWKWCLCRRSTIDTRPYNIKENVIY